MLFTAEMVPYLRDIVAGRESELHPAITRTLASPEVSLADYLTAERDVEELRAMFARWFNDYDVLLCPVVAIPAPPHAQSSYVIDGVKVPARHVMRATVLFNRTGLPAVSLPFGATTTGLPVGVQLVSRWWADDALLDLTERLEHDKPRVARRIFDR
ncbi:amidase family protein [Amycolatopsis lurida]